jgi:hypothetical protein
LREIIPGTKRIEGAIHCARGTNNVKEKPGIKLSGEIA